MRGAALEGDVDGSKYSFHSNHSCAFFDWLTCAPFHPRGGSTATVLGLR